MTVFKVGDKVRYVGNGNGLSSDWAGIEGEVIASDGTNEGHTVKITKETEKSAKIGLINRTFWPLGTNLELVPVEDFTYGDIKVGDKIKRTRTWPDGTEEITIGVVNTKGTLTAYSKDSNALAFNSDTGRVKVKLELLERPEPKPEPKIWENRKKGDKVIREDYEGALTVFTHEGDDEWSSVYLYNTEPTMKPEKGYDWDKTDIMDALSEDYTLTLIEA